MKKKYLWPFLFIIIALLNGCASQEDDEGNITKWNFGFDKDMEGFEAVFADYHDDGHGYATYEMKSEYKEIPVENQKSKGLYITSRNISDDIFMGYVKKLDGLRKNHNYTFTVSFQLVTDVRGGMAGIGGSPGQSVFVKGGITAIKPETQKSTEGRYGLNIDIGNQSESGKDMKVIGNMEKPEATADLIGFDYKDINFTVNATTDSNGCVYIIIGTDSGFEGLTEYYLDNIQINTSGK
ncbi:MAG: hypothetical protein LBV47_02690 [Bacteroidales bacterium]|jgi:hypothetical protein|nr:hypothetical protein [Bacteroidales bacterium]